MHRADPGTRRASPRPRQRASCNASRRLSSALNVSTWKRRRRDTRKPIHLEPLPAVVLNAQAAGVGQQLVTHPVRDADRTCLAGEVLSGRGRPGGRARAWRASTRAMPAARRRPWGEACVVPQGPHPIAEDDAVTMAFGHDSLSLTGSIGPSRRAGPHPQWSRSDRGQCDASGGSPAATPGGTPDGRSTGCRSTRPGSTLGLGSATWRRGASSPTCTTRYTCTSTRSRYSTRGGHPPGPSDGGWKDTVDPATRRGHRRGDTVTDHRGRYLIHCHNLEHEEMAMMAAFATR